MSDLEYESDNKEVLEKCCMVIEYHQNKNQEKKEAKHTTRAAIQHLLEEKRLRKDAELSI
jgi:hypothetical protein